MDQATIESEMWVHHAWSRVGLTDGRALNVGGQVNLQVPVYHVQYRGGDSVRTVMKAAVRGDALL